MAFSHTATFHLKVVADKIRTCKTITENQNCTSTINNQLLSLMFQTNIAFNIFLNYCHRLTYDLITIVHHMTL